MKPAGTGAVETTVDYGADLDVGPGDNLLAAIEQLAERQLDAEAEVDAAEAALKAAKERLRDVAERQLPEAMDQARQKEITTASNVRVKVVDKVRASVPEAKRAAAFAWLRENDHDSLIKTQLVVPFEAGRDVSALGLQELLVNIAKSDTLRGHIHALVAAEFGMTHEMEAAMSFLRAVGNEGKERVALESTVHSSSLAALVRELLKNGKIDPTEMETIGAHAWKEASVKRKD